MYPRSIDGRLHILYRSVELYALVAVPDLPHCLSYLAPNCCRGTQNYPLVQGMVLCYTLNGTSSVRQGPVGFPAK